MRSMLISIRPKWCELIAKGKKTMEIRKSAPKIETPFKCYIYCTQTKKDPHLYINNGLERDKFGVIDHWWGGKDVLNINCHIPKCRYIAYMAEGKVIGEFVCDCITPLYNVCNDDWERLRGGLHEIEKQLVAMACLREAELHKYANGKQCYAWHISDLKIYDKPKELNEFAPLDEAKSHLYQLYPML